MFLILLLQVNEAFAPQYLAVKKELGLNNDITNMNGGAIALGHPLAASGTRITGHLAHELQYVHVHRIDIEIHVFGLLVIVLSRSLLVYFVERETFNLCIVLFHDAKNCLVH